MNLSDFIEGCERISNFTNKWVFDCEGMEVEKVGK